MEKTETQRWRLNPVPATIVNPPPDTPYEPMEFLSRSWSSSALQVSKALQATTHLPLISKNLVGNNLAIPEDLAAEVDDNASVSGHPFSFASSETSQIVINRVMSHSQAVSPRVSGRHSHSSGPLINGGSLSDSPPVSPSEIDEVKNSHTDNFPINNQLRATVISGTATAGSGKTVGRWLKDRKVKKKEETRAHNAQRHAAISVAVVAAAVAGTAAATAAASGTSKDEQRSKSDMAVASAATLVAAQCVEAAEAMGAEREHLASLLSSAVNVESAGDIIALTAAAATALRAAATLKARALKDVWSVAAIIPVEKGMRFGGNNSNSSSNSSNSGELVLEESLNLLGIRSQELLAGGSELLKRTRKGDLHWKIVSVYVNRLNQVMLKMKSRHVAGAITKKKKNVVLEVIKDIPAWPGRHLLDGGENRLYFGLKTVHRGVVEFECRNRREYDSWTQGVSRLISTAAERNNRIEV